MRLMLALLALSSGAVFAAAPPPSQTLRYFEGAWHCDGVFPSNGRKISSALTFVWYGKTGSLVKQHDDEAPNEYHAIELWAASSKGGFQNMIADSFGGVRVFVSSGWADEALTWVNDADQTIKEKFTYSKVNGDAMRVDWAVSRNGAPFVIGDTLTCSRTKS
jgi:hypothetical protein